LAFDRFTIKILVPFTQISEVTEIKSGSSLRLVIEPSVYLDQIFLAESQAFDFDTAGFNLVMQQKVLFIERSLRDHKYLIYSDLDIAWLRDPVPLLMQILKKSDFAFQSEVQSNALPTLCFGFASIRSTIVSRYLFKKLANKVVEGSFDNPIADQVVLNEFYKRNMFFRRRVWPLSEGLFPNGLLYKILSKNEDDLFLADQIRPFIYHANFVIGVKAKAKFLRTYAGWDC